MKAVREAEEAGTTPSQVVNQLDLEQLWELLADKHGEQALLRMRGWVDRLFALLAGDKSAMHLPASPDHRPRGIYFDGLEDAEWFDPNRFETVTLLEESFEQILAEIRPDFSSSQLAGFVPYFTDQEKPSWRVRKFFDDGIRNDLTFERYPTLGAILDSPELPSNIGECQVSAIEAGGRIEPHFGPTNGILVCHLPLYVPDGDCRIRVGSSIRGWSTGKCFVFDDTFEHEVWNNTAGTRYVALVNLWHPDLTLAERHAISLLYPRTRELFKLLDK